MKLDEFRSRRPIDIIAKTNPIIIIDEPQSVEGEKNQGKFEAISSNAYASLFGYTQK